MIQWLDDKQMFVVWDEAALPLGYYDTKEEAEDALESYCKVLMSDEPATCQDCLRNERKWEFRYKQQWKKQKELESTIANLRKKIKELNK